jgi:hypothetical protein
MYILTRMNFNVLSPTRTTGAKKFNREIDREKDREEEIERARERERERESYTYSSTALLTTQAYHIVLRQTWVRTETRIGYGHDLSAMSLESYQLIKDGKRNKAGMSN